MKKKKGKKGKYTKAKKIVLGILIGYIALMVLGYIAGVVYFTKHFYLGSQINGMNASARAWRLWRTALWMRSHPIPCI